jgi:hypothetical protein
MNNYEKAFIEGYLDATQSIDVLYNNDATDCEECSEDDFDMYSDDDFDEELDEGFVSAMKAVIDKPRKTNINTALKKRAKAEAKLNKAFLKKNE